MIRLEWLFLMQFLMGIMMFVLLQKITQMKKQVDEIIREVKDYVSYITESEETIKIEERTGKEAVQNQLIQAVLGEYFP